jgi:hypothetical protein
MIGQTVLPRTARSRVPKSLSYYSTPSTLGICPIFHGISSSSIPRNETSRTGCRHIGEESTRVEQHLCQVLHAKELSPVNAKREKHQRDICATLLSNFSQNAGLQHERLLLKYLRCSLFGVLLESQQISQTVERATVAQEIMSQ